LNVIEDKMKSRCGDIFHLELIAYRFYKDVLNYEEEADIKLENIRQSL
jgi:hypothetical protein